MTTRFLHAILFATLVTGCTATGQVQYAGETDVQLVEVSPGVQVIADYDEPVFYSENYYWRYDSGVWYRSPYHTRGWVRVNTVPVAVRTIDRPTRYVHYHAQGGMDVRDHREAAQPQPQQPEVRDHREGPPPPQPVVAPVVRDHRDDNNDRHEQHDAVKEERHDQHEAVKEERHDQHEAAKDERKDDHREQKDERKDQHEAAKDERKDDHREQKAERKDDHREQKEERKDDHRDQKDAKHKH